MKKTFQKTLIAASVGIVMLSAAGTASANTLLFPYFTTTTGAQSVLSLSNTGTAPADQVVHYVYNYGPSCIHYDASGSLTKNDILSHSIAAPGAALGFGLVAPGDKSVPVYFPLKDTNGFLTVSSKSSAATDALRGSMAIVDPSTGLTVSYAGIDNNRDTSTATGTAGEGNYSTITDVNFPLAFMPANLVTTSWYAAVVGDMSTVIGTGASWGGIATFSNNGNIYNNDEVPFSGTKTVAVTCAGTVLPKDLMTDAQAAAVGANGGLIKATATMSGTAGTSGVVLMKMQAVAASVGAPFANVKFMHREQAGF